MEYKTRFHTHVIVGYSMYKIEAAAQFFAFATRILNAGAGDPSRPPYYISLKLLIDKRTQWNTKRDSIPTG